MRWQGRERSSNVDDRRGNRRAKQVGAGLGIGGIIAIILTLFMGGDINQALNQVQNSQPTTTQGPSTTTNAQEDQLAEFVSVVLQDTEDVWNKLFPENFGKRYVEPTLVIFSGSTESACGYAKAATGPFYCPADQKLYIDLSFCEQLRTRFKAPGDFAVAYIVAHEVGHHVQKLLGLTRKVQSQRGRISETDYNQLSVRLELQADFFAGIWAHHAQRYKNILEEGDIEEALRAASSVGDDHIQKEARGYVTPESFTHGTSKQRMTWFYKGLETGNLDEGDTFSAVDL